MNMDSSVLFVSDTLGNLSQWFVQNLTNFNSSEENRRQEVFMNFMIDTDANKKKNAPLRGGIYNMVVSGDNKHLFTVDQYKNLNQFTLFKPESDSNFQSKEYKLTLVGDKSFWNSEEIKLKKINI
jgi:hypothetical protein